MFNHRIKKAGAKFVMLFVLAALLIPFIGTVVVSNAAVPEIETIHSYEYAYTLGSTVAGNTPIWSKNAGASPPVFRSNQVGDTCSLTFTGSRVELYLTGGAGAGMMNVYIDGTKVATDIDMYNATPVGSVKRFDSGTLTNDEHTVMIEVSANANAASTNKNINIAKILTFAPDTSVPAGYMWNSAACTTADAVYSTDEGKTWNNVGDMRSATAGGTCEFTFYGIGVDLILGGGPGAGISDIYLDGVLMADNYDMYSATSVQKSAYKVTGLDEKYHVLKVVNTGEHNSSSTAFNVNVHEFKVLQKELPATVEIATADQLSAYIKLVNTSVAGLSKGKTATLTTNINMAGKTWEPIKTFLGTFDGNGKTISNITFTTSAVSGSFGLIVNSLTNNSCNGTVQNLTVKDSSISAASTSGKVGGLVGMSDRGRVINCTVDNVSITGNKIAGGIVGQAVYQSDDTFILVKNCTLKNSTLKASELAGGIVGIADSEAIVNLGVATVTDNKIYATVTYNPFVAQAQVDAAKEAASAESGNIQNYLPAPPPTGDMSLVISVLSVLALGITAVVINKRRRIAARS